MMESEEFVKRVEKAAKLIYEDAKVQHPPCLLIRLGWNMVFGEPVYVDEKFIEWLVITGWVIKSVNVLPFSETKQYLMVRE